MGVLIITARVDTRTTTDMAELGDAIFTSAMTADAISIVLEVCLVKPVVRREGIQRQ